MRCGATRTFPSARPRRRLIRNYGTLAMMPRASKIQGIILRSFERSSPSSGPNTVREMNSATPVKNSGRWIALRLMFAVCCVQTLCARDAFVLISGGDSPFANNYSQYLQARAVTTWFQRNYPPHSVWVFFGAGNIEGESPVFGDVRRQVQRDGLTLDSWVAGPLHR